MDFTPAEASGIVAAISNVFDPSPDPLEDLAVRPAAVPFSARTDVSRRDMTPGQLAVYDSRWARQIREWRAGHAAVETELGCAWDALRRGGDVLTECRLDEPDDCGCGCAGSCGEDA